jgi:hypothetical protein
MDLSEPGGSIIKYGHEAPTDGWQNVSGVRQASSRVGAMG